MVPLTSAATAAMRPLPVCFPLKGRPAYPHRPRHSSKGCPAARVSNRTSQPAGRTRAMPPTPNCLFLLHILPIPASLAPPNQTLVLTLIHQRVLHKGALMSTSPSSHRSMVCDPRIMTTAPYAPAPWQSNMGLSTGEKGGGPKWCLGLMIGVPQLGSSNSFHGCLMRLQCW